MSIEQRGSMPLNYQPVSYPGSVLRFRGPQQDLAEPYTLCLGGSETFGRFVPDPFAAQLDRQPGQRVVNMGVPNAGLDVMMNDPAICKAAAGAEAVVLQITGAQNMTNRFYTVHPRRNDRFLKASGMLRTIYREVDFTDFHFTRHLLTHLRSLSEDRFALVRAELQTAWLARMKRLLDRIEAPVHLLWLSRGGPDQDDKGPRLGPDPLFVTGEMLEEVASRAASLTVVDGSSDQANPIRGMFYGIGEKQAARSLPGPAAHDHAAKALIRCLGA